MKQMKGGVALVWLHMLEWNLAGLVQTRMVADYVEGCVSGGVAAGILVTCSVLRYRFTVQLRFKVQQ